MYFASWGGTEYHCNFCEKIADPWGEYGEGLNCAKNACLYYSNTDHGLILKSMGSSSYHVTALGNQVPGEEHSG